MAEILMNKKDWEEIRKGVNDAFESKKIKAGQKVTILTKLEQMLSNYGGKFEKLTREQVDELYKVYNEGVGNKVLNLGKWQSEVYQAVKSNKITEERGNEFMAKVRENKANLKDEDVKKMFDKLVIDVRSSQATAWKDLTKQELPISGGPQCWRLIRKIDNGEIQTKEQFDKELMAEKGDLAKQRESIAKLKDQLKENIEKEKTALQGKCKNIFVDIYFEDIEKTIDTLASYGGMDILLNELIAGKSLDQVQKNVLDLYNKDIQKVKEYVINESDALNALKQIFEMLSKVDNNDAKQLISKIQNVQDQQGVMAAAGLAKKEIPKITREEQKDLKDLKNDLVKAQKAAENDKEVIALSQLELEKINTIAEKPDSELKLDNYKSFRAWVTKGKNAFKRKVSTFIEDAAIESKKDKESVERILSKKCDDATWVMFANQKDYDDCCKNIDKAGFYMASSIFSAKDHPLVEDARENVESLKEASKIIATVEVVSGTVTLSSGQEISFTQMA